MSGFMHPSVALAHDERLEIRRYEICLGCFERVGNGELEVHPDLVKERAGRWVRGSVREVVDPTRNGSDEKNSNVTV
jgi:hypothetical protein